MTQGEVLEILEREKRWMTAKELAEELGKSSGTVTNNLNKLEKQGEVDKQEQPRGDHKKDPWSYFNKPYRWRAK